jgi:hypothetical protein
MCLERFCFTLALGGEVQRWLAIGALSATFQDADGMLCHNGRRNRNNLETARRVE